MFKGLSEPLQMILTVQAQTFARRSKELLPEHVLLGMLSLPEAGAYQVMRGLGVSVEGLRERVQQLAKGRQDTEPEPHDRPPSKALQTALSDSAAFARTAASETVDSVHLLLAIVRNADGPLREILSSVGVTEQSVGEKIAAIPPEPPGPGYRASEPPQPHPAQGAIDQIMHYLAKLQKPIRELQIGERFMLRAFLETVFDAFIYKSQSATGSGKEQGSSTG